LILSDHFNSFSDYNFENHWSRVNNKNTNFYSLNK
jgi:hypothetical protein